MDQFNGTGKDFRGLFKVPKENIPVVSASTLRQQICITAKDQYEATNCECNVYGLDLTKDKHIVNWISRAQGKCCKSCCNCWILPQINDEMEMLHPSFGIMKRLEPNS